MFRPFVTVLALICASLMASPLAARDNGRAPVRGTVDSATNASPACKSTAGQSSVDCPLIFAPGSTAPKTHTTNQPVPTANQIPPQRQVPTTSSLPMKMVTPGDSVRSERGAPRGAAAAPDAGSASDSAGVMMPAPAPPPPPPPAGSAPVAAAPLPAVGTVITSKPPLTADQEIANYGSFDASGNFVLNPGVSMTQQTNFVQVQASGKEVHLNVGQLKLFMSRGLLGRDGSAAPGSPFVINHAPPASAATQFPPGTRIVPMDHVSSSGSTQNIMPGGAGIPLAAAELGRIGVAGGGAPVDPQGLTSFYNTRVVDGHPVYVQMTQSQVATAVKSGMLKPDGSWQTKGEGMNQGTAGSVGGDLHPTVVFLPAPPAPRAPMTPPAPGAPRPPQAPPLAPAEVPTLKPGFVAYPHYVGPRDPNTGYPVPPSPPTAMTPPAPGAPQAPPLMPYNVPPLSPLPTAVSPTNPVPGPGQVVDVPRPRPQPASAQRAAAAGTTTGGPSPPMGSPPPPPASGPATGTVVVTPKGSSVPVGSAFVTAQSGRQPTHAIPTFEAKETGDRWHCVASGHRVRKAFDAAGNEFYAGALPGIGVSAVAMVRDVPAWHDLSTDCLIAVGEHPKARDARR
jgi:hypothetical protein